MWVVLNSVCNVMPVNNPVSLENYLLNFVWELRES